VDFCKGGGRSRRSPQCRTQKKKGQRNRARATARQTGAAYYLAQNAQASGGSFASQGIISGEASNGSVAQNAPQVTATTTAAPFGEVGGSAFIPQR
jgi:hypothetical protein